MASCEPVKNFLLVFIAFCPLISVLEGDNEFEGLYHVPVEHSFDQGPSLTWSKRGVITIRSISNNQAQFVQSAPISEAEASLLKDLSMNDGFYRLRVPTVLDRSRTADATKPSQYVTTFIKACVLYESSLSDFITLNADTTGTSLMGVSLTAAMGQSACSGQGGGHLHRWNSSVEIRQTVSAPLPDTMSYVQKIDKEKAENVKGTTQDNRSFLAKYWMYIVPVFLLLMVASSADQGGGR